MKIVLWSYDETSPTGRMTENDSSFSNTQTASTGVTKRTELVQISNTCRQQITNNNSNSTNSSTQRLTTDQLEFQDSKEIIILTSFARY
ncbi:hypothetical protein AVEN_117219-1 [Araneus ventricosus]|uniref:Uncharacterized protein n=1 Tax=Araneus ventricosus TaxID=182803 RepID=A0A4Y2AY43_ARAVE|nr:hypothetical protein AVEN_117219-1 [Araneus ventricosus]